jgi:hypothetical protein
MENTPNNQQPNPQPVVIQPSTKPEWTNTAINDSPYQSLTTPSPQGYYQPPSAVAQGAVNATPFNKTATALFILMVISLFAAPILFIPILIFAGISSRRLVRDSSQARKSTNILVRIFTVLGWIAMTICVLFVAFIAIALITLRGNNAKCG